MAELGQHIIMRLRDDRVIASSPEARREVARVILEAGRTERLLAFNAGDTHMHTGAACSRDVAGNLARRIEIRLGNKLRPGERFAPANIQPIKNQQHLVRVFFYVLRQQVHHGFSGDLFHDGTNLPDLLGLRLLGSYTRQHVQALMPRITRNDLLRELGVQSLEPMAPNEASLLAEATLAAAGLAELSGRSVEVVAARRAAVHAAAEEMTSRDLAGALRCAERTIQRMRSELPDPALVRAIQLQFSLRTLRSAAAAAAALDPEGERQRPRRG